MITEKHITMKRLFTLVCATLLSCAAQAQLSIGDCFVKDSLCYKVMSDSTVETKNHGIYLMQIGQYDDPEFQYVGTLTIPDTFSYLGQHFTVVGIGELTFCMQMGLERVLLPNTIKYIKDQAFLYCTSLTDLILPSSLDSLFSGSLSISSRNIQTINIPASVRYIQPYSFMYNSRVQAYEVDRNNIHFCSVDGALYSIDTSRLIAFPLGKEIEEYTVHDSTKIIDDGAFALSKLRQINLPQNLLYIGALSFVGCKSLRTINIPAQARLNLQSPFVSSHEITHMSVDEGNPYYEMRGTSLFTKTGDTLLYMVASHDTTWIPQGTKVVGHSLFLNYEVSDWRIKAIVVPEGVQTIMDSAFACRAQFLRYVRLPKTLEHIGNSAFSMNLNLAFINIPQNVKTIGEYNQEIKGETNVEIIPVSA